MHLTWTVPAALWLLAIVPLVWLARRFARTNFNPRQQTLQAVVRSLLLIVIAAAMARPVVSMGSSRLSIVYLVDVSHSIGSKAIEDAAATIERLQAGARPSHSQILAFGSDVATVADTAALKALAKVQADQSAAKSTAAVQRESTDLERALHEARSALMPGHVPRIVLFTDGRETAGTVRDAVTRLAAEGVPVFVEPMAPRDLGDTWVDRIDGPRRVPVGTEVTLTLHLGSQRAAAGGVELREGTTVLAAKPVAFSPGEMDVPLDVKFDRPGPHVVEASVVVAGDPLTENNKLGAEILVDTRPRVLYVEGATGSTSYLRSALDQAGFDVTAGGASILPPTRAAFEPWDVVILSDLPRASLSEPTMIALGEWVEHDGGGLLVAGGESVFGEGSSPDSKTGYRKTEIERLTPVTFERKDEPEVALIIVLDKSWSMAGQQMELCKTAAQAAIDVMADEQSVGVITFNDEWKWEITLRNVGKNRDEIRKTVAAIEPSGHTLIYPAIEQAFIALKEARARAKHVVLLSDGRSYPDDYEGLVKKMVEAKMTVSAISVGAAADVELLTNIAKWGKGRSYVVEDAKEVPQIFVKEAKNAMTPGFDEKTIKPVVKTKAFLEGVDVAHLPPLRGRTATVLKDKALQLVATEDGDPLLAFWPIGLGRTAVFASDVKDRWATDWVKWRGYGPFFGAIVRALQRQSPPGLSLDVSPGPIHGGARMLSVTLESRTPTGGYGELKQPHIRITTGSGKSTEVAARQSAPGRYEAFVTVDAFERLNVGVAGGDQTTPTRIVVPDPNEEYRFRQPDQTLLKTIADATGGLVQPSADALRATGGATRSARRALWPTLVIMALALWFVDIGLRRVRVFER